MVVVATDLQSKAAKLFANSGHVGEGFFSEAVFQILFAILCAKDDVVEQLVVVAHCFLLEERVLLCRPCRALLSDDIGTGP